LWEFGQGKIFGASRDHNSVWRKPFAAGKNGIVRMVLLRQKGSVNASANGDASPSQAWEIGGDLSGGTESPVRVLVMDQ